MFSAIWSAPRSFLRASTELTDDDIAFVMNASAFGPMSSTSLNEERNAQLPVKMKPDWRLISDSMLGRCSIPFADRSVLVVCMSVVVSGIPFVSSEHLGRCRFRVLLILLYSGLPPRCTLNAELALSPCGFDCGGISKRKWYDNRRRTQQSAGSACDLVAFSVGSTPAIIR